MSKQWYYKELVSQAVLVNGKAVKWEQLDGNRGVLVVDSATHPELAQGLATLVEKRKGGVVAISEQVYNDKKKALKYDPSKQLENVHKSMLRIAAAANMTDPLRGVGNAAAAKAKAPTPTPRAMVHTTTTTPVKGYKPATARVGRKPGKLAEIMQQQLPQK